MMISSYADFLAAARQQAQPQRLLFVFASAALPQNANDAQRARFENGQGGELHAVMCVDKLADELGDFASLAQESSHTGKSWDIAFAAALSGRNGVAPASDEASRPLDMMIESIRNGNISNYLAFNRDGELVQFA